MVRSNLPVISVITIVYNGELFLERTMLSVLNQTYGSVEYLVIDGGSKDGTLSIIEKYVSRLSYWVSEKDKGLYDAMNKGLQAAKGEYVIFMNAGDEFHDSTVLERVVASTQENPDIYYGETLMVDEKFNPLGIRSEITPHKLPKQLKWTDMAYGMVVCHQSILVRKSIAEKFDLSHPFCADIDWIIKSLKKSTSVKNVHFEIAKYLKGGISDKKLKKSLVDRFSVMRTHFGLFRTIINHIFITGRALWFYNRKK